MPMVFSLDHGQSLIGRYQPNLVDFFADKLDGFPPGPLALAVYAQ